MAAGKDPHQRCRWRSWSACPAGCWSPAPCPCPCPRACWATASGSRPPPGCTAECSISDDHLWSGTSTSSCCCLARHPNLKSAVQEQPQVVTATAAWPKASRTFLLVSSRAPQPHFQGAPHRARHQKVRTMCRTWMNTIFQISSTSGSSSLTSAAASRPPMRS